mgnify:FL=1
MMDFCFNAHYKSCDSCQKKGILNVECHTCFENHCMDECAANPMIQEICREILAKEAALNSGNNNHNNLRYTMDLCTWDQCKESLHAQSGNQDVMKGLTYKIRMLLKFAVFCEGFGRETDCIEMKF